MCCHILITLCRILPEDTKVGPIQNTWIKCIVQNDHWEYYRNKLQETIWYYVFELCALDTAHINASWKTGPAYSRFKITVTQIKDNILNSLTRPLRRLGFIFLPWPWSLTYVFDQFNLANTFWALGARLLIFHMWEFSVKNPCLNLSVLPCDLDLRVWPTFWDI